MDTLPQKDIEDSASLTAISFICFGTWISLILYGQYVQEVYTYFCCYPKDGCDLKAIVPFGESFHELHDLAIWGLDRNHLYSIVNIVHVGCMIHVNYSAIIEYGSSYVPHWHHSLGTEVEALWHWKVVLSSPGDGFSITVNFALRLSFFARRVYKHWQGNYASHRIGFLKGTSATSPTLINIIAVLSIFFLLNVVIMVKIVGYLKKC
ncbi:hypothetical protein V8D89_003015 [Ganoderma adspersum]